MTEIKRYFRMWTSSVGIVFYNIGCRSLCLNKPNIAIVGDSMIKNINPRKLSRKRVNKFMFPGKRAEEIASEVKNINVQYIQPMLLYTPGRTIYQPTQVISV